MPREIAERQQRLVRLLRERGELDVATLVRELATSEATLRRDLTNLERSGDVVRTFGGARPAEARSLVVRTFGEKREQMRLEKEWIGREAARQVQPGMVVALDSGTTVWRVAAALREIRPLTVITSALAPIEELGAIEDVKIHLVGGRFRRENLDFVGPEVAEAYAGLRADYAFIGADSYVPGRGVYSTDAESGAIVSAIARCARQRVLVCDHTKFNARGCCLALASKFVACIVTDDGLEDKTLQQLKADGRIVVIASKTGGRVANLPGVTDVEGAKE